LSRSDLRPTDIAKELGVSISSVYNAANSYFVPGRELAVKIEKLSDGVVSVESWSASKARKRAAATAK
jgi:transposase